MKLMTLLTLVLVLNACSFSDRKEEVAVNNDDLEFAVDTIADEASDREFQVEEQKVQVVNVEPAEPVLSDDFEVAPVEDTPMTALEEPSFSDFKKPEEKVTAIEEERVAYEPIEAPAKINLENLEPTVSTNSAIEHYRFQKGDTLMMVAFKIYGDYRKWKDIKKWNSDKKDIVAGTELKYYVPDQKFGWRPDGLPYLVKTGDTLQIISMDKYNTTRKWKSIYNNNKPLIRNPNLIFAGFTIYYQPTRDLASQSK